MDVAQYTDVNEIEQTKLQHQQEKVEPKQEDEFSELLRAAKDAHDTDKSASGELVVYQWYFQAAGGLNFIMFLVLCSLFVVGTIYPRTLLLPALHDRSIRYYCSRQFFSSGC